MSIKIVKIEITNYCNLKCPYCFFCDFRSSNRNDEMSLSELNEILYYCEREGVEKIFLLGGEPMMHSHIEKIIKILKRKQLKIYLFTNGLFDSSLLTKLVSSDFATCLVNYNHPNIYESYRDWELVNRNIGIMSDLNFNFRLGYNLYEKKPNYKFFVEAIKKLKLKIIRWDVPRPSRTVSNKYWSLKDVFDYSYVIARFMKDCINAGAYPRNDCILPICLTMRTEFNFMKKYLFIPASVCNPHLNIGPGLRISSCSASMMTEDIRLTDFKDLSQASEFIKEMERPLRWRIYLTKSCKKCVYWVNKLCQAGCIGYKRIMKNKVITRKELNQFLSKKETQNGSRNKLSLLLKGYNNFDPFRMGVALLQRHRYQEAFKMFIMVKINELNRIKKEYVESFLKVFLLSHKRC